MTMALAGVVTKKGALQSSQVDEKCSVKDVGYHTKSPLSWSLVAMNVLSRGLPEICHSWNGGNIGKRDRIRFWQLEGSLEIYPLYVKKDEN